MHWNILDRDRIFLLNELTTNVDIGEYYMSISTSRICQGLHWLALAILPQ